MSKIYGSRKVVVLGLLFLVLAPWQLAAQAPTPSSASLPGLLQQVWSFLLLAWQGGGAAVDPGSIDTSDAGCRVDPWGCPDSKSIVTADAGCQVDPLGCTR